MSTKLGTAKVYFTKEDLGKMLKLKDKDNLMVTDVEVDNVEGKVAITITTPMDNITNDRVKQPDGTARRRFNPELFKKNAKLDKCDLKIFEYIGNEIFELVIDTKTNLKINDFNDYNDRNVVEYLMDLFTKENIIPEDIGDFSGVIMIGNEAVCSFYFSEDEEIELDCIEIGFMTVFIKWYRSEYDDNSFNGADWVTNLWGYIE